MSTRLIVNLSQTYISMYLINTLGLPKVTILFHICVISSQSYSVSSLCSVPSFRFFLPPTEVHRNNPISDVPEWLPVLLHHEASQ